MKKLWIIGILFCACVGAFGQESTRQMTELSTKESMRQDSVMMPHIYVWRYVQLDTHLMVPEPQIHLHVRKTDRGMFGGQVLGMRIYGDLTLPTITSECLVDVGAAMSRMGGLLGQCTRWFTMFDPMACPTDELFGSPKANTAIMVTMRTYF